jgi:hypothetical protein
MNTSSTYSETEILTSLDAGAHGEGRWVFAILELYEYVCSRLSIYRSPDHWAMAFEILTVYPSMWGHDSIRLKVVRYSDSLTDHSIDNHSLTTITEDSVGGPVFDEDDQITTYVRDGARSIRIRGEDVPIPTDVRDYERSGLALEELGRVQAFELMRFLTTRRRDLLVATDEEIAGGMPDWPPLFLRLDYWHHIPFMSSQKPSENPTFRALAHAMVVGDTQAMGRLEAPNTHWTCRPNIGM